MMPQNLRVDTFPDPVSHFGAPGGHIGFCRRCRWWASAPSPLGWYFNTSFANFFYPQPTIKIKTTWKISFRKMTFTLLEYSRCWTYNTFQEFLLNPPNILCMIMNTHRYIGSVLIRVSWYDCVGIGSLVIKLGDNCGVTTLQGRTLCIGWVNFTDKPALNRIIQGEIGQIPGGWLVPNIC